MKLYSFFATGGLVVGFNLPFDISRLAIGWGETRDPKHRGRPFARGFSFRFAEWVDRRDGTRKEDRYKARIRIKHVDSKRSFIGLGGARTQGHAAAARPQFLDCRTLAFALTGKGYSLDGALEAFGCAERKMKIEQHGVVNSDAIDYNRQDVRSTLVLFEALRAEFSRHDLHLLPSRAYSPASIAKAYLGEMRLTPPLEKWRDVSPEVLGIAMTAYYGGRSECRIRRLAVPVVYCDFLSMYPTVNSLMGLWRLLTAASVEAVDVTLEATQLVQGVTLDQCFTPSIWSAFNFFAEVEPDGDILPVRARYEEGNPAYTIGLNPVTSAIPLWYAGPDLVASTLLTGRPPKIRRAFRVVGIGQQPGLRPITLRGAVRVDPAVDDFFRQVIEERYRIKHDRRLNADERERLTRFLKVLATSGSYGIFAQMDRRELPAKRSEDVHVYGLRGSFPARTGTPEDPGRYCFPPVAALISAAARLMLALLERSVTDLGGTYAFADTDSMAIVATETGGKYVGHGPGEDGGEPLPVPALSHDQVLDIVERFRALSPYSRDLVPESILKIEDENYAIDEAGQAASEIGGLFCLAISSKRYCLFNYGGDGTLVIRKPSEHGLGHYLDPDGGPRPEEDV